MNTIDRNEWEQWRKICRLLIDAKLVTEEDMGKRIGERDTPGLQLLSELRDWGDLRFEQGKRASLVEEPGSSNEKELAELAEAWMRSHAAIDAAAEAWMRSHACPERVEEKKTATPITFPDGRVVTLVSGWEEANFETLGDPNSYRRQIQCQACGEIWRSK
jgi:hypothetical protein